MQKKIGLFGGTFNPIHIGHLILAKHAISELELDQLYFLPTRCPPHKQQFELASGQDRAEMIRCAIAGEEKFGLLEVELLRQGTTYTIDTLLELQKQNPLDSYYFLIGADTLLQLPTWRRIEELFSMVTFAVAMRPPMKKEEILKRINEYRRLYHAKIHYFFMPQIEISSHSLRERVRMHQSIRYEVPEAVWNYMKQHQLYQEGN